MYRVLISVAVIQLVKAISGILDTGDAVCKTILISKSI